jgi:hypothetical protein
MKPTLSGGHDLEEQQLWHGREMRGPTPARFRSIHDQGFLRREGDQGPLRRGKARRVEHAAVDVFDRFCRKFAFPGILRFVSGVSADRLYGFGHIILQNSGIGDLSLI